LEGRRSDAAWLRSEPGAAAAREERAAVRKKVRREGFIGGQTLRQEGR
jgi:hypothetical protein